jgi:hypothetical protein
MNFTREEIEEIKGALEAREYLLNDLVDNAHKFNLNTNTDTELARKYIERIQLIISKLDNANVIYLWRE